MDQEKSPNRTKRQTKVSEDYWDCSVCTYRNTAEAFKCSMCDIRKGTSTRKPRINPQLVAQQAAPQFGGPPPVKVLKKEDKDSDEEEEKEKEKEKPMDGKKEKPTEGKKRKNKEGKSAKKAWRTPRLKNVDRSTAQTREITVNNVSVLITEYKLKKKKTTPASDACSTTSEGSHTDTSTDTRSAEVANDTRSS